MYASFFNITFGCIVFLALFQVVTSIDCFQCASCSGSSNSWSTSSSSSTNATCFKYVYSVGVISYTNRGLTTSCTAGSDGLGGTYYCCSSTYCNGNVSLSSSLSLALALVVALIVFKEMMNN